MRIGVVSDTHLSRQATKLPDELVKGLSGVQYILHAGDWVSPHVFDMFNQIAPCEGVAGNNDGIEIIEQMGKKKIIEWAGYRIGLVHGHGYHTKTEIGARLAFLHDKPDIIVFGHSHIPYLLQEQHQLIFNPGSPTDKRTQERYSYGILELTDEIRAWHEYYVNKS
jgi:putative phosphoesterase